MKVTTKRVVPGYYLVTCGGVTYDVTRTEDGTEWKIYVLPAEGSYDLPEWCDTVPTLKIAKAEIARYALRDA